MISNNKSSHMKINTNINQIISTIYIYIYQNNCELQISSYAISGNYGVALQIEDFKDASSTTPLSSVPLQFVINVSHLGSCNYFPAIVSPSPPDGFTLQTNLSGSLQFSARAYSVHKYDDTNFLSIYVPSL